MPTLEAGLFFTMLGLASFFTFGGLQAVGKISGALHMLAMALFIGLAIFMASGYAVMITTVGGTETHYNVNGTLTETVHKADSSVTVLPGGTASYWLWYLFFGFGLMNLVFYVRDILSERPQRE